MNRYYLGLNPFFHIYNTRSGTQQEQTSVWLDHSVTFDSVDKVDSRYRFDLDIVNSQQLVGVHTKIHTE